MSLAEVAAALTSEWGLAIDATTARAVGGGSINSAEISGRVPLCDAHGAKPVDTHAALHRRALCDALHPRLNIFVRVELEERVPARRARVEIRDGLHPRVYCHVGNGKFLAAHEGFIGQMLIKHVQLALDFHRVPVDGVFDSNRSIVEEVAKPSAQKWGCPHLPHEPIDALGPAPRVLGDEVSFLFREVQ